ncbi:MAG: methyltransferase [Deltaproteobacteria bacterium]|nr:methyltransferase [Deltaproteobacteria bacterium]
MDKINEDETLDEIGGVRIIQKKRGYRFSADSLLLADFPDLTGVTKVMDLGTGSGIIAILLARRSQEMSVVGVELQDTLFELAKRNVDLSSLSDRVEIVKGDMKGLKERFEAGRFDLVVCNPPYYPIGKGRIGPNLERTVARHEAAVTLADIIGASEYLLRDGGRVAVVYPADRYNEVISVMRRLKIGPLRAKEVHTKVVEVVLVEGKKGYAGELLLEPPFCL